VLTFTMFSGNGSTHAHDSGQVLTPEAQRRLTFLAIDHQDVGFLSSFGQFITPYSCSLDTPSSLFG
jgi:hypothetical protein